ncbi:MAG TPA: hypothetical protein VFA28_10365 [Bryobacteraceae bacterium]|jgi:drug/metabolite transporter (DMT)-like permease|nr:hypothetical protein [Bryobacteraceae bacterium]
MRNPNTEHILHRKSAIFALIAISASVAGNSLLSRGMREIGPTVSASPLDYLAALLNPFVAGGVALLVIWLLSQLSLLSWADLSYVLPITSTAYALTAIVGRLAMHDHISPERWLGIGLITLGAMIVGRTYPRTTGGDEEAGE